MFKVLYVNAMRANGTGEAFKRTLTEGLNAATGGVEVDAYDIFYGAQRFPRLMGQWFRDRGYGAVVLSGSEKNISDPDDPWVHGYLDGLRDLLDFRGGPLSEWDGPPVPVFGICFGHQALARVFGAEVAACGMRVGMQEIRALPRAFGHAACQKLLASHKTLRFAAHHGDQVIRAPSGFHATFTSDYCAVQGMAHDRWPVFSLQTHPEADARLRTESLDPSWKRISEGDFARGDGSKLLASIADWMRGKS